MSVLTVGSGERVVKSTSKAKASPAAVSTASRHRMPTQCAGSPPPRFRVSVSAPPLSERSCRYGARAATFSTLYAWPGGGPLLAISATALVALAGFFAAVVYLARRAGASQAARARGGRWLAPMTLLGLVALGLAPAVPGSGEGASPLGYFFYDLRWWWLGGALVLVLNEVDSLIGAPLERLLGRGRAVAAIFPPTAHRRRAFHLRDRVRHHLDSAPAILEPGSRRRTEVHPLLRALVSGGRIRYLRQEDDRRTACRQRAGGAADPWTDPQQPSPGSDGPCHRPVGLCRQSPQLSLEPIHGRRRIRPRQERWRLSDLSAGCLLHALPRLLPRSVFLTPPAGIPG